MTKIDNEFFDVDCNNLDCSKIVLLSNQKSFNYFLKNIFPLYTNLLAFCVDDLLLHESELNKYILNQLRKNDDISIVIIGAQLLSKIEIKSKNLMVLDSFIFSSISKWESDKKYKIDWNQDKITWMIKAFFQQRNLIARPPINAPSESVINFSSDFSDQSCVKDLFI